MLENNAQVMELSNLLSDELVSFCGDFNTDDDIDAMRSMSCTNLAPPLQMWAISCGND